MKVDSIDIPGWVMVQKKVCPRAVIPERFFRRKLEVR